MPTAAESAYTQLLLQTRAFAFASGRTELQNIARAMQRAAADLSEVSARLGPSTFVGQRAGSLRSQIITVLEAVEGTLSGSVEAAVNNTVTGIVNAHAGFVGRAYEAAGVPAAQVLSGFDRLDTAVLDVLAARRGGTARTYQTLIRRHIVDAAPALDDLLSAGIARGQSIDGLTKAVSELLLERVVSNPALNLPRMGGLSSIASDARRIARTETMNAMREANNLSLLRSEMVAAAKWQTNSNHKIEDTCDEYAAAEHGYGPGFWPLKLWPLGPHPHCGCYHGEVKMLPVEQWGGP